MNPTTDAERRGSEPAYPSPIAVNGAGDVVSTSEHLHPDFHGLTKREAFAMAAMQGLLANTTIFAAANKITGDGSDHDDIIGQAAVEMADALLNRLSLNQEPRA